MMMYDDKWMMMMIDDGEVAAEFGIVEFFSAFGRDCILLGFCLHLIFVQCAMVSDLSRTAQLVSIVSSHRKL